MPAGQGQQRRQKGQATVELMLVLPVIVMLALLIAQVGLVARDSVLLHHVAREAAREAAVNPSNRAARQAALRASGLAPERMTVTLVGGRERGDHITARLSYSSPTAVPLVGALLGDVNMQAEVTMRVE